MQRMLGMRELKAQDLQGLAPASLTALAAQMIEHIQSQARELDHKQLLIEQKQKLIERKDRDIAWRDAKLEKVNFELARLKRWKFGAKTEAMTAEQRRLFEETLAEDEASLQAQLDQLRAEAATEGQGAKPKAPPRRPRREALPAHLRRVEHRHEPEDTTCRSDGCGQPMTRIGEDVSERLDIVPAEFFVHRHIYGKWTCRCCQTLKQEPAAPEVIDGGMAASGLLAHTLINRFADHLPYYRQETINARSGVHTPRSTLAAWAGQAAAALEPLYDVHKRFVLGCRVLHAARRRWRCWTPGRARPAEPTSGPMPEAITIRRRAWSTTSASAAERSTRLPSWPATSAWAFHDGPARC